MMTIDIDTVRHPSLDKKGDASPNSSQDANNEALGVIEHLKDEFGDYSDPLTYDWTWRETD